MRAALESLAVTEIVASPGRHEAAATLREALSRLADPDADFAARLEADLGFHLLLCRLAGNSMLVEAWRGLEGRIRVAIMNGEPTGAPVMMTWDRHAPIVEAIEAGDRETAISVVAQHMAAAVDHFAATPATD